MFKLDRCFRCIMDETVKIHPSKHTAFNFELQSFKFTDYDQVTKLIRSQADH